MVEEQANELTEYLVSRSGENLRAVIRYSPTRFWLHYLRDDIEEPGMIKRMKELFSNLERGQGKRERELTGEFGRTYVSLQMRERGVILHFPRGGQSGVIVGFEPDVAKQLSGFIHECLQRME